MDQEERCYSGSEAASVSCDISTKNNSSDQDQQFLSTCTELFEFVTQLYHQYGEHIVSSSMKKTLEYTRSILDSKCLCMSVLGQHNSGKSTFINALLGDEYLPMSVTIETSVRVEVQHSSIVHQGFCSEQCFQQQRETTNCPWLEVAGDVVATGANDIYEKLQEMNQHPETYSVKDVLLRVNIPLLSEKVPPGWQLSIIDNPGFGDARVHITQIANDALLSSSVYVYLLDLSNIGSRTSVDFFRNLYEKDQGAIQEGRLIVGIAKFDDSFKASASTRRRRQAPISEDSVKSKVIQSVDNIIQGVKVSDENIIAVSGSWGLAASMLYSTTVHDTSQEVIDERLAAGQKALEEYPNIDLPGGQDQSQRELINQLDSNEVVKMLDTLSGFNNLKKRLMSIGKTCLKLWRDKISNQCRALLQEAVSNVEQKIKQKKDVCHKTESEFKDSEISLKQINDNKQVLEATTSSNSLEAKPILKKFEETYTQDIKEPVSKRLGRDKAHMLVSDFKKECKEKIGTQKIDQAEFERCLQGFLKKCETELEQEFYTSCSFPTAFRYQSLLNERVTQRVERLGAAACGILSVKALNQTKPVREEFLSSLCNPELELQPAAIKLPSSGPTLSCLKEDVISYLQLLRTEDLEVDEHRDIPNLSQIRQVSSIRPFSLSERLHKFFKSEPFFAPFFLQRNSQCASLQPGTALSIQHPSIGDHRDSATYLEWTELEEAVDSMTSFITEACDEYFATIKDDVVQHFFEEYRAKATERLEQFDKDYSKELAEKIKELDDEIKSHNMEIEMLNESKDTMVDFCQRVCPQDSSN